MNSLFPLPRAEIAPGAVHVPGWLTLTQQRELVDACRGWARGPAPMRHAKLPDGGVMSVRTVCLGWHWLPYRYSRTADDVGGAPVAPFPNWLAELGRQALADAYEQPEVEYRPDAALINYYGEGAKLGMHQDKASRFAYHGVPKTLPGTAVAATGLTSGRLNLTLRVTGLE